MQAIDDIEDITNHETLVATHRVEISQDDDTFLLKVAVWERVSDGQMFGEHYCDDQPWKDLPWTAGKSPEEVVRSAIGFAKERARVRPGA